jgi:hypothetical protein
MKYGPTGPKSMANLTHTNSRCVMTEGQKLLLDAESECALRMEEAKNYCPNHPDIVACVDFLHNATNKTQKIQSQAVREWATLVQNSHALKKIIQKDIAL